jgi:prophage regulatory protein
MADNINPYRSLPYIGFIRQSQLIPSILPFSPATLWRKVKDGTFPQPVKLGQRPGRSKIFATGLNSWDASDGEP